MGARRKPETEQIMAELLAALVARPGEWFTTEEACNLTSVRCRGYACEGRRRPSRNCWQCRGTGRRPRMGWEGRRYLMHLLRDGLVQIIPGRPPGGTHQWSADVEAVELDRHWRELAEQAG